MKLPKTKKRLCPSCKKHTEHRIVQVKSGKPSPMSRGSKHRARARGLARGMGNLGRISRPAISKWKMTGKKVTKKTDLKYVCSVCKKAHIQKQGIRAKRVEFI